MQKKNTTVLKKQKRAICIFKCWLNCQWASVDALLSLEKTVDDPTPPWSAVLFFASCRTKAISVKFAVMFFVSHRRNMSGKIIFVVTERCKI